jgi:hypothetical protein
MGRTCYGHVFVPNYWFFLETGNSLAHVLLAGESVTNPRFLDTLRDVLDEMPLAVNLRTNNSVLADPAISKTIELTFAGSRGAALYARRRQEVQTDCTERSKCEEIREGERVRLPLKDELR